LRRKIAEQLLKRRPAQLAGAFIFADGATLGGKIVPRANTGTKNKGAAGITTAAPHITG
jgi:hypothetical protein